jgi:uncharacterized delta-60 repeat protein
MKKFIIIFCFLIIRTTFAQTPGTLDISFGSAGIVLTPIGISHTHSKAILLQPDGKIVVVGETNAGGVINSIALARYKTNGSLDSTFGTNGIRVDSTTGLSNYINASVLLPNGKILIGGGAIPPGPGSHSRFMIARYNANGTPDHTFGTNGFTYTQINDNSAINAMVVQQDGKIIAAGSSSSPVPLVSTIARYDSTGQPDLTFGTNGIVTTVANPNMSQFTSVGLLPDGRIIAGGTTLYDNNQLHTCFLAVRYHTDGALDLTFGTNGIDMTGVLGLTSMSSALSILAGGKFLLAGEQKDNEGGVAVARYNADGGLDPSFGTAGKVVLAIGDPQKDLGKAMTIQPVDGKILVTGVIYPVFGNPLLVVIRFTADGVLDVLFGDAGFKTIDMGLVLNYGDGICMQPDGKILFCSMYADSDLPNDFALARLIGGDFPVGIPGKLQQGTVKTYPNPVTDKLMVETSSVKTGGNLCIYNIAGEVILNVPVTGSKMSVDVSKLETGIYFVRVTGAGGMESGRFVKTGGR